jgi:hypothetical protein
MPGVTLKVFPDIHTAPNPAFDAEDHTVPGNFGVQGVGSTESLGLQRLWFHLAVARSYQDSSCSFPSLKGSSFPLVCSVSRSMPLGRRNAC